MQFVNPVFLFGLFAIAIPVIIHLFNFRRFKKVFFTNVRFIRKLKQETKKRSELRHLIILALRILAIASLVMAFAQPYIPFKPGQAPIAARNAVSIFVDNSFSMEATGKNGTLLDEAVQKAREIAAAYKGSDDFHLLTNDFEGRHQRLVTREEFFTMLEEIKPSPSTRNTKEIITRQGDILKTSPSSRHTSFIVSDFQRSAYSVMPAQPDSSLQVFLVPLIPNSSGNIYIDSCWFDLPLQQAGQTAVLNSRIWNKSGTDMEKIPVKLEINGQQKALSSVDLKAGASAELKMPFTNHKAGIHQGVLQVQDFPVVYDDKFYFSYTVTSSLNVLAINGKEENRFLRALYNQDSSIRFTNVLERSLDYSKFSTYNLIILNELQTFSSGLAQEIRKFITNGGTIAIIPAPAPDLPSYNAFLTSVNCPVYLPPDTSNTKVSDLSTESPVFRDVFEKSRFSGSLIPENMEMPVIKKHFPILPGTAMQTQSLMKLVNGKNFITVTQTSEGQVFQFAVPFDLAFSNFPQQVLFVPVLYNIALVSRPPLQLYQTAGNNEGIRINQFTPAYDNVFRVKSMQSSFELIPEHRRTGNTSNLFLNGQLTEAGNYLVFSNQDTVTGLAFNYNRLESDPGFLLPDELEELLEQSRLSNFSILKTQHKPVNEVLEQINYGTRLWKYFIWAALLFLLAEVILLRIWKY